MTHLACLKALTMPSMPVCTIWTESCVEVKKLDPPRPAPLWKIMSGVVSDCLTMEFAATGGPHICVLTVCCSMICLCIGTGFWGSWFAAPLSKQRLVLCQGDSEE